METSWLQLSSFFVLCVSTLALSDSPIECLWRKNLDLVSIVQSYGWCLKFAMNITNDNLMADDNDLCRNDIIIPCFFVRENLVADCLHSLPEDHVDNVMRSSTAALRFLCQNNGQIIKDFVAENSTLCFQNSLRGLNKCSTSKGLQWQWFTLQYFDDDCRVRAELINCMLHVLDKCHDRTSFFYFLGIVRAMLSDTTCRSIISSEYPHLSSSSVISPNQLLCITLLVFLFSRN